MEAIYCTIDFGPGDASAVHSSVSLTRRDALNIQFGRSEEHTKDCEVMRIEEAESDSGV